MESASGVEDFNRYRADRVINTQKHSVVTTSGEMTSVECRSIKVGDLVRVNDGHEIPCDMVGFLLSFLLSFLLDRTFSLLARAGRAMPITCSDV